MAHSRETWKQHVIRYSIRHQLRFVSFLYLGIETLMSSWKKHLVQTFVPNERQYYEGVLRFSRLHHLVHISSAISSSPHTQLYPYHLSDVLIKGLRVTPFKYYLEMMAELMLNGFCLYPHLLYLLILQKSRMTRSPISLLLMECDFLE